MRNNCSDGDVRLVGGSDEYEGRVEVCINQAWGTVCNGQYSWRSTYWGTADGRVVCRQLRHQELGKNVCMSGVLVHSNLFVILHTYSCTGLTVYGSSQFGQGTGPIFFTDVGCSGSESSLLACSRNVFAVSSCTHSRDVGLKCEGTYSKWGIYV